LDVGIGYPKHCECKEFSKTFVDIMEFTSLPFKNVPYNLDTGRSNLNVLICKDVADVLRNRNWS